jgi:electron transfer flavoprotein alpha subunit
MEKSIWVYLQREGEGVSEESLLALSVAGRLAREAAARIEGVWVGPGLPEFPQAPTRIFHLVGGGLGADYQTLAYGTALQHVLEREHPLLVIFPSTTQGQDLASWVGGWSGVGALVGAREVLCREGGVVATRLEFDGKVAVEYLLEGSPAAVALEQGVGEMPGPGQASPEVVRVEIPGPDNEAVRVLSGFGGARRVDLRSARAIVGVGAGVGGPDGFQQVCELASVLGAELGATRAAVDAGWLGHERQIGQTGLKVKPDLYVACGISGAVQHRVGMVDSGTIVSINMDPQAPIFRFSHYCVLGDVRQVVPKLLELLRR